MSNRKVSSFTVRFFWPLMLCLGLGLGLMALVGALVFKALGKKSAAALVSGVVSEVIMVVGYFGYAGLLLGKGIGAAASIPGNLVQAAMGLVIGFVLLKVMQKTRIAEKI